MNASTPADTLLDVKDLSVSFGARGLPDSHRIKALREVSLAVRRAETLAVVGESGCGKTTLLRCITGLLAPETGSVTFEGTRMDGLSNRALLPFRRRIQMVFQKPLDSLNRRSTVGEIVAMPLIVHGIGDRRSRTEKVEKTMEDVGLNPAFRNRYPHELSGGQQQRVAIARALILEPDLIVADEPVSSLDVSVQGKIINLLLDLQEQRGLTYLLISHDLGVVERMADRILVMYLGRIVEEGPAEQLLRRPSHPYTRALTDSSPRLGQPIGDTTPLEGEIPSPLDRGTGCPFESRCASSLGEVCRSKMPPITVIAGGVKVRCHLYPEGK